LAVAVVEVGQIAQLQAAAVLVDTVLLLVSLLLRVQLTSFLLARVVMAVLKMALTVLTVQTLVLVQ
jgi:hypothetical protein